MAAGLQRACRPRRAQNAVVAENASAGLGGGGGGDGRTLARAGRACRVRHLRSGQVRPLALSPDGRTLLALNTPDGRLEIFAVGDGDISRSAPCRSGSSRSQWRRGPTRRSGSSIICPTASASSTSARPRRASCARCWSATSRATSSSPGRPTPTDTSLAPSSPRRAVGQNLPDSVPPNLTTPGTPRALVYVFDAAASRRPRSAARPQTIIELFGDTPRALAASPDGHTVYAAIFQSGNQTTTVTEGAVCDGGAAAAPCALDGVQVPGGLPGGQVPGGLPAPNVNIEGIAGPGSRADREAQLDQRRVGRSARPQLDQRVRFNLPDRDVFRIDALRQRRRRRRPRSPTSARCCSTWSSIRSNGALYVSNTDAHNEVRFEGPGTSATTVRGHLHEARITVIDGDERRCRATSTSTSTRCRRAIARRRCRPA